jgi:hypothetical protein
MKAFEERLHSGGLGVCRAFEGECVKLRVCMAFEGRLHTSGLCVCMTFEGRLKDHAKTILFVGLEGEPGGSPSFAKMAADQKAEDLFLSQLASFSKSGRSVSDSPCRPKTILTKCGAVSKECCALC